MTDEANLVLILLTGFSVSTDTTEQFDYNDMMWTLIVISYLTYMLIHYI